MPRAINRHCLSPAWAKPTGQASVGSFRKRRQKKQVGETCACANCLTEATEERSESVPELGCSVVVRLHCVRVATSWNRYECR